MERERLVSKPAVYTVPEDLSQERHTEILLGLTEWFSKSRSSREPASLARQELDYCMRGLTKAGKPWLGGPKTLAARVRSMCRFDIEKMEPLLNASDDQRRKKDREKELKRRKDKDRGVNVLIPDELRSEMKRDFKAGDNPAVFLSSEEHAQWLKFREDTLRDYPHLNNTTSEKILDQLADRVIIAERQRMKFLSDPKSIDHEDMAANAMQIERYMKILGIDAASLIKRKDDKKDTSIAGAALRMSNLGDYRKLRLKFWAEELLQIFAMFMQPTADGLGYQLDDVGLYGLTKSRVVHCPKCGTKNWAGLAMDEIQDWLIRNGHLKKIGSGYPTYQPGTMTVDEMVAAADEADAKAEREREERERRVMEGGDVGPQADSEPR